MAYRLNDIQRRLPARWQCRGGGLADARRCRTVLRFACLASILLGGRLGEANEELGPWHLDRAAAPDGAAVYTASLYSTTLLDAGGDGADYAPTLTFACRTKGEPRWSQWLRFDESLTSGGETDVDVSIDGGEPIEQPWKVGTDRRMLLREDASDIAALKHATRVTLAWNWGWSWLWLSDEASFELVEFPTVIYTLSKSCGIAEP